jgi:predicted ester cyclase
MTTTSNVQSIGLLSGGIARGRCREPNLIGRSLGGESPQALGGWHDAVMEEANKQLVRAYTSDVFDNGDVSAVDRYLAPDFFNHVTGRSGTEDFKRLAAELGEVPGRSNVIEFMVAEGDLVVAFMTITRTVHRDMTVFGYAIEGRGQSYTVHHVHIYRVAKGKIVEHWALRDDIGMLRQLGAIESPSLERPRTERGSSRPGA